MGSRLSLEDSNSEVLCFRKRDMKPLRPGPAEAGGEATDGGEILKRGVSFALEPSLKKASGDKGLKVMVCEEGGVLTNSAEGCEASRPVGGFFARSVPRNRLIRALRVVGGEIGVRACVGLIEVKGIVSTLVDAETRVGEDICSIAIRFLEDDPSLSLGIDGDFLSAAVAASALR